MCPPLSWRLSPLTNGEQYPVHLMGDEKLLTLHSVLHPMVPYSCHGFAVGHRSRCGLHSATLRGSGDAVVLWLSQLFLLEDLRDAVTESIESQVGDGMQTQLAHDIGAMGFCCLHAEIQGYSHFLAGLSFRQKLHDLALARS